MNDTAIGGLHNKPIWSPAPFKDLSASIGIARAIRSEYFGRLIRGWKGRTGPGKGRDAV